METTKRPTFQQTVDVLVKAYLNDTLYRLNCGSCAVGEIIRVSGGFTTDVTWAWSCVSRGYVTDSYPMDELIRIGTEQIEATGYTPEEINRIEHAFMFPKARLSNDINFNGLLAVVDVLADIHNVDLSIREDAKALFVKA